MLILVFYLFLSLWIPGLDALQELAPMHRVVEGNEPMKLLKIALPIKDMYASTCKTGHEKGHSYNYQVSNELFNK